MSWADLGKIVAPRRRETANEGTDYFSNVLLQVVLPMVLVLGFIVFTRLKYLEQLLPQPENQELVELVLELQRQVLVKKLEECEAEKKIYWRIDPLISMTFEVNAGKITDNRLKEMCSRTFEDLGNDRARKNGRDLFFQKVIEKANAELTLRARERGFRNLEITAENRKYVRNETQSFFDEAVEEAIRIQTRIIGSICSYFIDHPDEFRDEVLSKLIKEYVANPSGVDPGDIYERILQKIQTDLEDQSTQFLPDTWQRMLTRK